MAALTRIGCNQTVYIRDDIGPRRRAGSPDTSKKPALTPSAGPPKSRAPRHRQQPGQIGQNSGNKPPENHNNPRRFHRADPILAIPLDQKN
jgi:hypothetical protein